jgi:hypothetical protein
MSYDNEGPGFRCTVCGFDWPLIEDYRTCPSCLLKTDKSSNIEPMSEEEAEGLKNHFEFERFYEEWDEAQPPERLETHGLPSYKSK